MDPAEQEARAKMQVLRGNGLSLRAIAAAITADGFPISHSGVAKLLEQATIAIAAE